MKTMNYLIAAGIIASFAPLAGAQTTDTTSSSYLDRSNLEGPLFRSQELNVDIYGSGALGEQTLEHLTPGQFRHHSLWGGGAGLTAFFCRYVGVGGEFDADARSHQFVDSASGNVYLRYPIMNIGLAPYIFGGGGYQFEEVRQAFGQGGAGVEYRFCRHMGVFVDGRWIFADETSDYALARAGLRFSF